VHPDLANEVICSIGGMIPKLGIDGGVLWVDDPDDDDNVRGGRCRLEQVDWFFLWYLYGDFMVVGGFDTGRARTTGRFPPRLDEGAPIRLEEGGMPCIATAAVASADRPLAMTRCCEGDLSAVHLHFNRLLQLQGFRSASTYVTGQ